MLVNSHHIKPRPYGVGLYVKEPKIAESYSYSLISSFKQLTYDILPLSTEKDLSKTIKNDKPFANSLKNLFSKGWKIFPADSYTEGNYYAIISPESVSVQETRDAGFQYEPFNGTEQNTVINKIFNEAKVFSTQGATEGKSRFDIEFNVRIKDDTIEGFSCKILEYKSIIKTNSPLTAEMYSKYMMNNEKENKNGTITVKSRMVVFNYCDRAAVMVWALYDENLLTILKEIRKFMT